MNGEISITLTNGQPLHFKFCNRSEFLEGVARKAMGYDAFESLPVETAGHFKLYAAIQAHKGNEYLKKDGLLDFYDALELLDYVKPEDHARIMQTADDGMGFMTRLVKKAVMEDGKANQSDLKNGKVDGKPEKSLHLEG